MSGTLSSVYSFFYENQMSQLGVLFLDVLTQESLSLPSEATKYPVEDGSEEISDHITRGNEELTIQGSISAATSFGMEFGSQCYSKMIDAIDQLRAMHKERKPITIQTGLGRYEDMAFTQLTVQRQAGDKGGQWLDINATLRQIKKVALKETELPPDRASNTDGAKGKTGKTEKRGGKGDESNNDVQESWVHSAGVNIQEKTGKNLGLTK